MYGVKIYDFVLWMSETAEALLVSKERCPYTLLVYTLLGQKNRVWDADRSGTFCRIHRILTQFLSSESQCRPSARTSICWDREQRSARRRARWDRCFYESLEKEIRSLRPFDALVGDSWLGSDDQGDLEPDEREIRMAAPRSVP